MPMADGPMVMSMKCNVDKFLLLALNAVTLNPNMAKYFGRILDQRSN